MSRPLILHVSALSNAEFTNYTASIHDIVEYDAKRTPDYDKLSVGVREARAWLRGRYPTLASTTLDSILRLFSPELGTADVLTGGQFFAALRLVSHVLSGKEMDPNLVFVQAHPDELTSRSSSPLGQHPPVSSPIPQPSSTNGLVSPHSAPAATTVPSVPAKPPPPSLPPKPTNPFLNRRASQDLPPQSAPPGTGVFSGLRPTTLQDGKTPPLPPRKPPVLPPPRHASMNAQHLPPVSRELPPHLPNHSQLNRSVSTTNTLIQQSLQATRIAQSLKKAEQRLEQERVMEVLKSSSDFLPHRMRSKSPTKDASSSASSAGSTNSSADRTAVHNRLPRLPPRRNLSPPASTVISARSFERVATASLSPLKRATITSSASIPPPLPPEPRARRFASPSTSPPQTPPRPLSELPSEPPPTHPDRKVASLSMDVDRVIPANTSPRVGRSKSLHHPSPPPVPPPPRRKRPESAQLTPTSSPFESPFANPPSYGAPPPVNPRLSRHLSLSSNRERERDRQSDSDRGRDAFSDSPIGSLQKTLTSLSLRAQPALDTARYKAEGALSRRGFVQHSSHGPRWMREEGEKALMDDVDDAPSPGPDIDDADSSIDQDADSEGVEDRARRWREGGVDVSVVDRDEGRGGRKMVLERDDMKWPAGDGWRPL